MNYPSTSLGAPAAERDHLLLNNFVKSEIYDAIASNKACILIGNRGCGKSAIFRMFAQKERKSGAAVVEISPDEYSYEFLGNVLRKEIEGSWAKQGSYSASWKYVLYVTAMKEAIVRYNNEKSGSYKKIFNFLKNSFRGQQNSVIDHLVSYMKRFEKLKLGVLEFGPTISPLKSLYELEEVQNLLEPLKDVLSKNRVTIIIDELDRGWDGSEDAKQFVAGLFQAAIHVNRLTPNLRILISLRREIYDNIPQIYDDAQKVRDLVRYVEWEEDGLKEMAARRIHAALEIKESFSKNEAWRLVFAETLSYRKSNSFKYIVDRTLYRPREIIQFCNECFLKSGDSNIIDYGIIAKAEAAYSADRFNDICSEYKFQYPGIRSVFECFRGGLYNMNRSALDDKCAEIILNENNSEAVEWLCNMDERRLIRVLWAVGFIKAKSVGGQKGIERSGSRYLGSYQISNFNTDEVKEFHVHPMFRSYLGMKEK
ncbi:MoxR-like ATPase [Azospirillum baldaniorum]|uniref:P-loop ATPase, Sll1717 family n=1 Tax=Azospirillum baldaniorum TaxID=1064539 RepID=UPI0011A60E7F|nr:hypothetical protein [Azospirillum baldaniorum]TWA69715.1 MoxR-like ATPase [Azospirillum baldaniorum]